MSSDASCLICQYCVFAEGGRFATLSQIRSTGHHVRARCSFFPQWIEVWTSHRCGQFEQSEEFARRATEVIHGTWDAQELAQAKMDVSRLKRELAAARRVSAGRLARLSKGKPPKAAPTQQGGLNDKADRTEGDPGGR